MSDENTSKWKGHFLHALQEVSTAQPLQIVVQSTDYLRYYEVFPHVLLML